MLHRKNYLSASVELGIGLLCHRRSYFHTDVQYLAIWRTWLPSRFTRYPEIQLRVRQFRTLPARDLQVPEFLGLPTRYTLHNHSPHGV